MAYYRKALLFIAVMWASAFIGLAAFILVLAVIDLIFDVWRFPLASGPAMLLMLVAAIVVRRKALKAYRETKVVVKR